MTQCDICNTGQNSDAQNGKVTNVTGYCICNKRMSDMWLTQCDRCEMKHCEVCHNVTNVMRQCNIYKINMSDMWNSLTCHKCDMTLWNVTKCYMWRTFVSW